MNIYQLQNDLLDLFNQVEENDGELTPELEEKLFIKEEEFKDKVRDYTDVIKLLQTDLTAIKVEQKRLKDLYDRKQKVIDRISKIILDSIDKFGATKKSGVRYIDYGTGEVSIRNTKSVEVDNNVLDEIASAIRLTIGDISTNNQLDVVDRLDSNSIVQFVAEEIKDDNDETHGGYNITEDDLSHANVELSVKVPVAELLNGEAYPILREIAKHTNIFSATASVSKSELKRKLEENGACAPNLAKLVTNKTISIK